VEYQEKLQINNKVLFLDVTEISQSFPIELLMPTLNHHL